MDIRKLRDEDDYKRWVGVFSRALHEEFKDDGDAAFRHLVDFDRSYVAEVDGQIVGTACDFPLTYRLHGGEELPIAAVTGVAVLATHRRRGILRQMMTQQLHDIHGRGEPLAALGATESVIYGRFGYGSVDRFDRMSIDTAFADLRTEDPREGTFRFLSPDEARDVLPKIYVEATADRPGEFTRTDRIWNADIADPEAWRHGGKLQYVTYTAPDGAPGYVSYRIKEDWMPGGLPNNQLRVVELVGRTPAVVRQLLRWVLEVDLIRTVQLTEPTAQRFLHLLLRDPRRATVPASADSTWLRIVDLPRVLASRRYLNDGTWTFAVTDAVLAHNRGPWRLEVIDGVGTVVAVDADVETTLDIADLASVLMGATGLSALVGAARADSAPEVVQPVDRLFAVDRAAYAVTGF